jgi:hypothetical protein
MVTTLGKTCKQATCCLRTEPLASAKCWLLVGVPGAGQVHVCCCWSHQLLQWYDFGAPLLMIVAADGSQTCRG